MQQPLPELNDDVVREILARIPPDESAHLARAALVCKTWRRVVLSGSGGFLRRYRELHRTPPLIGFLHKTGSGRLFFPTAAACPFARPPEASDLWWHLDYRDLRPLDCRHGRVLFRHLDTRNLIVWDPVAGDWQEVPDLSIRYLFSFAMVLCAVAGCDHCACAGGPFLVVFVCNIAGTVHGCVYSSEAHLSGPCFMIEVKTGQARKQ
nr:unnamed protein product [Digitaria exilis]